MKFIQNIFKLYIFENYRIYCITGVGVGTGISAKTEMS